MQVIAGWIGVGIDAARAVNAVIQHISSSEPRGSKTTQRKKYPCEALRRGLPHTDVYNTKFLHFKTDAGRLYKF
jgi:hypothetical protein